MLLGILLHAALAYIPAPWPVQDPSRAPILGLMIASIHGFRMQLFFMLSGFFCAMLWQRRGTRGLLAHRAKRIALPLAISMVTIIPAILIVNGIARSSAGSVEPTADAIVPERDLWTASAFGDIEAMAVHLDAGAPIDAPDPTFGVTPLGWAVIFDRDGATAMLIERGADLDAPYRDEHRPLHSAMFFGRAGPGLLLLDAGADLSVTGNTNETPADALRHPKETVETVAGWLSVPVDFDDVSAGRDRLRAALPAGYETSGGGTPQSAGLGAIVNRLTSMVFFHHLWFLWYLCWFVVGFVVVAGLVSLVGRVPLPRWLVRAPGCLLWVVPLTAVGQSFMQSTQIGADTSLGLLPMPRVLLYYAVFFGFGALLYGATLPTDRIGRGWWAMLPVGVICLMTGLVMSGVSASEGGAGAAIRAITVLTVSAYAWTMTFGVIGLFEAVLREERAWVRYLSDSSYWLYLAHLPLVIALQAVVRVLPLPGALKMVLVSVVATLLLLLVYQWLIRYMWIGRLLNGRRERPEAPVPA